MVYELDFYNKVINALNSEPSLERSSIAVSIKDKGVVVLAGKVKSYAEKYIAEKAVKNIEDVHAVVNELEVDLDVSYKRNDAEIAQDIINALRSSIFIPDEHIKVTVENGYVTLSGEVEYYFEKQHAEKAIQNIIGIRGINNLIVVKSHIAPSDIRTRIIREFEKNARNDASNIMVEVNGSEVTLKGKVKNFDEAEMAKRAVWSIPGITKLNDQLIMSR